MSALKKGIGVVFIVLAVGTSIMYFTGRLPVLAFWLILGLCALVAYVLLPRIP